MVGAIQFLSLVLLLFSGIVIVGNWLGSANYYITGTRYSQVPLIGGLMGAVAFATSPIERLSELWWLPPVVD